MENIDLRRIERNVFCDYCEDGLLDILFGAYLLFVGLLLPTGMVALFVVLPIFVFAPVLRGLKKRFTYPRTGYVRLRQGDPRALRGFVLGSLALGLVALVAVLIAAGVIAHPGAWYRYMPVFFGIWLAGAFLGLALRVGLVRYYVVAGVALACGPTIALLPLAEKLGNIGLFFTLVGAVLLACGASAFVRFLRRHPLPAQGAGDVTH